MGWTCASFGRFLGSFTSRVDHSWCCWHVRWSVTHLRDRSCKYSGDPHNVKTSKTSSWGRVWGQHFKMSPNFLKLTGAFILESAGEEAWVSEWVSRPSWLSSLPPPVWLACLQPASLPLPALPRKFPSQSLTSPRDEELESRRGKNNNLRRRGLGKAIVGLLLGKAFPCDIQIYMQVSWWAEGQCKANC